MKLALQECIIDISYQVFLKICSDQSLQIDIYMPLLKQKEQGHIYNLNVSSFIGIFYFEFLTNTFPTFADVEELL